MGPEQRVLRLQIPGGEMVTHIRQDQVTQILDMLAGGAMGAEQWVEVELTVTDQANKKATRHIEYAARNPDPVTAASEIADHLRRAVGPERIHNAGGDEVPGPVGLG